MASYVNNGSSNLETYGGTASDDLFGVNATEQKTSIGYKMVYEGNGTQSTDYNTAVKYKGDAVYETSDNSSDSTGSWFSGGARFPYSGFPFFIRGNGVGDGEVCSFGFASHHGDRGGCSFRPMLAP